MAGIDLGSYSRIRSYSLALFRFFRGSWWLRLFGLRPLVRGRIRYERDQEGNEVLNYRLLPENDEIHIVLEEDETLYIVAKHGVTTAELTVPKEGLAEYQLVHKGFPEDAAVMREWIDLKLEQAVFAARRVG